MGNPRIPAAYIIAAAFVAAGFAHFAWPQVFERIVPPFFPQKRLLVQASGSLEVIGGLGAVFPASRRFAGYGLVALLIAVFPANVYMAVDAQRFAGIPVWVLYARLPLQFVLIWWVYTTLSSQPR